MGRSLVKGNKGPRNALPARAGSVHAEDYGDDAIWSFTKRATVVGW